MTLSVILFDERTMQNSYKTVSSLMKKDVQKSGERIEDDEKDDEEEKNEETRVVDDQSGSFSDEGRRNYKDE